MNINITLDVTPGTARRLAWVAVTLLLAAGTAAAYAVPVTFVSQQKLTAAQLNQNFADLDGRLNAISDNLAAKLDKDQVPIITEWQKYTPTLTTKEGVDVANQTTTGYHRRVGDTLEVRVYTLFTDAPASGSLWWQWGLPDNLLIDSAKVGGVGLSSVGHGLAQQGASQLVTVDCYVRTDHGVSATGNAAGSYYFNDTTPVPFGNGGQVGLEFKVPVQGWAVN